MKRLAINPFIFYNSLEDKTTEAQTGKNNPLILVADDQEVNQKLFSIFLKNLGYPMLSAIDGQDALNKVRANDVGLVFMDILMPGMNGYDAARNLRNYGFKKPIVAVTASEQPDERAQCLEAGIDDLLAKPFKQIDVANVLQKWLGGQAATATGGGVTIPPRADEIFNAALIMDNFSDDRDAASSILSIFLSRTKDQIDNFPNLEKTGDWDSARRDAHSIKGSAGSLGGARLREAAARLETACKSGSRDDAKTLFPLLCEAFVLYKRKAEEFINSRS